MMDKLKLRGDKVVQKIKWSDYIIRQNDDDEDDYDSKTSSSHESS